MRVAEIWVEGDRALGGGGRLFQPAGVLKTEGMGKMGERFIRVEPDRGLRAGDAVGKIGTAVLGPAVRVFPSLIEAD